MHGHLTAELQITGAQRDRLEGGGGPTTVSGAPPASLSQPAAGTAPWGLSGQSHTTFPSELREGAGEQCVRDPTWRAQPPSPCPGPLQDPRGLLPSSPGQLPWHKAGTGLGWAQGRVGRGPGGGSSPRCYFRIRGPRGALGQGPTSS